ncbi:hypothetical protein DL237_08200 [Pseudooceanicola sediminis]|uniref:Anti-sigma K factor RskA C-terminal domain-containing protein n=1 Tax=Pseudooceanicola sediminis TaxID=2211117 RepID=A0A399J1N1_9RHOB|nr:anti-sigma factor [Pseudooceanicola sediminis]KAA2316220.1 hypothetical protein E0K93_05055 [Puniceibacterium sp. HSS470]RII39131.1 hypothetical protein DL237_08200 [Pseudooceanicola sediminis]|tara:strand:+ start:38899 stop:39621 length:723 start_codon:yes stop_codon:yes gene_type:complete
MSDAMSDDTTFTPGEEDMVLAAEYVLTLLGPSEVAAFEERLVREPALRALVAAWADDFVAMTDNIDEARVPPRVWRAIHQRLWPATGADTTPAMGFWARLGLGKLVVAASVAAMFGFLVYQSDMLPGDHPEFVATLGAADAPVRFAAAYDVDTGELRMRREGQGAAAGRSYELWLIAGDAAPVSVMVWPADTTEQALVLPANLAGVLPGATLAISDEPLGGSPTGQPTGAVLAAGPVTAS